jgi:ABC-type sugar transport system substrate-binding protein
MSRPFHALIPAVAVLATIALATAGCSVPKNAATATQTAKTSIKNEKIAFSICCSSQALYEMADAMQHEAAAEGNGVTVKVLNAGGDATTQVAQVQQLVNQGYNAIAIVTLNPPLFTAIAKQAESKGIGFFNLSGGAVTGATSNITVPTIALGYPDGVSTGEWMKAHGLSTAEVGATTDTENAGNGDRTVGFIQGLHSVLPNVKVWTAAENTGSGTVALADGQNLLQAHPQIRVLFAFQNTDVQGLLQAANEAGFKSPDKFLVTTADGVSFVYTDIASKTSLLQLATTNGLTFIATRDEELIEQYLFGKKISPSAVARPAVIDTTDAAQENKEEASPWLYPNRLSQTLVFSSTPMVWNGPLPDVSTPVITDLD